MAVLSLKQLRILKILHGAGGWLTRNDMKAETGPKGFSKALGAPTRGKVRQGSLEQLGYVARRDHTRPFEYRTTELGKKALTEYEEEYGEVLLFGLGGRIYPEADEANDTEQASEEQGPFVPNDKDRREVVFRQIKVRRGQQVFRQALRQWYGDGCLITGCRLMDVVEAAHIKPYQGEKDNHPANGLLLRADLHTLFDLDLIGIEPETLIVRIHKRAKRAGYNPFEGVKLRCTKAKPSTVALAIRWESFRQKS